MADNYDPKVSEPKWKKYWQEKEIFKFNEKDLKSEVFSIDTPPPTISGRIHIGHSFSYSQQDFIVRYQRMKGKNIFYPFGTDNNGVATERLIEKMKGIRAKDMDRDKFVKICLETVQKELMPQYVDDMKTLGLSCDFTIFYDTIDKHSMKISQKSFIDLYHKKREYRKDAPTMWCPTCETGISQVECEDKEMDSFFNDIVFKVDGKNLLIATTRPELLPACVAIFYHPDDERYKKYKGKKAKVPLFNFEVPILADERADPEKGTGIVMCCTFGDQTDMEWQKAHNLPIKMAISTAGKMTELAGKYQGMAIKEARKAIIEDMREQGLLLNQKPIRHAVNVHERCGTEVEFIKSKQWFIKYLDLKNDMLKWAEALNWYPKHMKVRYDNWVKGLQWDWLISRQRFFGVPFPVWYCKKCDEVILADEKDLPVDPLKDKAPVKECPKCKCKELIPERDVMDTWATSSLTPRLSTELVKNEKMRKRLYPMSLRPQAHDIITFWLFNTVVKSRLHDDINPWKDVAISGHIQDPHGKKMSKSKGNVIAPLEIMNKYSADALRFLAGTSKLGDDMPFQEKELVTATKTMTKMWNASKFVFMHLEGYNGAKPKKFTLVDRWLLSKMQKTVKESTESFEVYEYSKAKSAVDLFFWRNFCDNYLEIVKDRLYNSAKYSEDEVLSAKYTLYHALLNVIKIFAPVMVFITEDLYQTYFKKLEKKESIHVTEWPMYDSKQVDEDAEKLGDTLVEIASIARKFKSQNGKSLKEEVKIELDTKGFDIEAIIEDLRAVAKAKDVLFVEGLEAEKVPGTEIQVKVSF
ncbi:valine--tRNA ligase [Candidatus Woesearchaeota archaeon]|nr:valine--tRNA ligase [Candidatus Woesearchaeota archaeon]